MNARSAYTFIIVVGFLLILYSIAHILQFPDYDPKLIATFIGIGVYLILLAVWMFYKNGVVKVVRTYELLGASTTITVFGFLLILFMLTLRLMDPATDRQLMLIMTVLGAFFMLLGTLIIRSDKQVIHLDKDVR